MRRVMTALLGLVLGVSLPVAALAGTFESSAATGSNLSAQGAGLLVIGLVADGGPVLSVSGTAGRLVMVDESAEDVLRFPMNPDAESSGLRGNPQRYESTADLSDFMMTLSGITDDDAMTIVKSEPGLPMEVTIDDRFQASQVADEVVESSHVLAAGETFPPWQYYEYRTGDAVELATMESAEVIARGNLEIYFWGQTLSYESGGGAGRVHTGYAVEASDGQFRGVDYVRDEHSRYAILTVTDGILQYTQSSGPLSIYSSSIDANPQGVTYRSASGSILTSDGRLAFDDDFVRAEGGSYRWTLAEDGLAVSVLKAPQSASAANGVFVARDPGFGMPSWTWVAATAVALVLVALYFVPTVRGGQTVPTGSGWSARRADGYASLAASAEAAGWNRLAAFLMAWSLRVVPADPLRMVDLAILRARIGRHDDALTLHETAHGWLVDAARGDDIAHNAYEAAKAAAVLGRSSQALDWMRMAVEADPGLVTRVGREPAFASLRGDPDYASLTVGGA